MKVKDILKNGSEWIPGTGYGSGIPIVSVLLPTFRRAKSGLFEKAVQSVLKQSLKNIELIIIDDGSTDGTADLIEYFMKSDSRVSCICHTYNVGLPAISEYEGYLSAQGEYIAFVFDDNEWEQDYLNKTISYMVRTKTKATYGIVRSYHGEEAHEYIELGNPDFNTTSLCDLLATNFIANSGVVLQREVIENVGLYDPHLTLTRLCDWDLWRRVTLKYRFEGTGVLASSEHGAKLNDSLGNTVPMNPWCSIEQMVKDRNDKLLPSNFSEYDISSTEIKSTDLFVNTSLRFLLNYENKAWFSREQYNLFIANKIIEQRTPKKRVLVVSNCFDATTNLSFERIMTENNDIIFRFAAKHTFSKNELIYADALICVRNIKYAEEYINICSEFKIPCYYYIDDNFIDISKENKNKSEIRELAKRTNYHDLKRFEGVFLSSQPLVDYFKENNLHENLTLMEPVMDVNNIQPFNENNDTENITIAFMGGGFRMKIFKQTVLPALERLADKKNVTVFYPKNEKDIREEKNEFGKKLKLICVPYSLSLDLTLFRYGAQKPDILIHCGPDIKNNLYKTENSLINAVQLGAILVASDTFPYKGQNNKKQRFVLVENTDTSWFSTLLNLMENPIKRKEIYTNALEYCKKSYDPNRIQRVVNEELVKIATSSCFEMLCRYDDLFFDLLYHGNRFSDNEGNARRTSRSLLEIPLSLSKLIPDKTSYNIRCKVENFLELGLCFGCFGECAGYVKIEVYDGRNQIREVKLNLDDLERDSWTYLQFDPIKNSMNKIFTIVFEFTYELGSSYVGVFEDATRRTFFYKVMNKFGHHMKGMDALFADCRS